MNVLDLEGRVVRYTIATSAEMDTIPPWPRYNETRDTTGRHMTLLETRVAFRVVRNEYGTDTGAFGRRRALEWLDSNARALWEPPLRLRLEPKATAVDPMRCATSGNLCGIETSMTCECSTCGQWRWAFGEGRQAGRADAARAVTTLREFAAIDPIVESYLCFFCHAHVTDWNDGGEPVVEHLPSCLWNISKSWAAVGQRKGGDQK